MVGVQLQHHYTPRQNQNSAVNHNVPAPFLSLITSHQGASTRSGKLLSAVFTYNMLLRAFQADVAVSCR